MDKWKVIILSIFILIVLMLIYIDFQGINVGVSCGSYNFMAPYDLDCKCIGIKTGGCPITAFSCDKASYNCLGIKTECYKILHNGTKEIIPCE